MKLPLILRWTLNGITHAKKILCWLQVFDWMISCKKQQTSAFSVSAPASRPRVDPFSRPLLNSVLPKSCLSVPLHVSGARHSYLVDTLHLKRIVDFSLVTTPQDSKDLNCSFVEGILVVLHPLKRFYEGLNGV